MNDPGARGGRRTFGFAALSLLVTAAAFLPTLGNGFTTWDDPLYILENPLIRSLSPGNVAKIFTTASYAGNYHPLTLLFSSLEYAAFGASPFGYHLASLLLHLGVVFLVFRLVGRLTGSGMTAFGVAILFGVHPLHLEPVAWVADQKDLLYSLFYVGAMLAYLRAREGGGTKVFLLAVVPLFILSSLSKGLAVTLPVTFLLLELFLDGRIAPARMRRIIPLFALSVLFGVLAVSAQNASGAITNLPSETFVDTILYASAGYLTYLLKLLVPFGLSPYYAYPAEMPGYYRALPVVAAGVVALALLYRKKSPLFFFGVAFFTVTILPVLQLLQVGNAMMADRYAYLPSIGILMIVVHRMEVAAERLKAKFSAGRVVAGATGAVYALTLAAMTFSLGGVWHDGFTMWDRVVARYPDEPKGYFNRGYAAHTSGNYSAAIADYDKTLSINPAYPYARLNRGISLLLRGDKREALEDFNAELVVHPGEPKILLWRGTLFSTVSEYERALADYAGVLKREPGNYNAVIRRALVYTFLKRYSEALDDYTKAIALNPSDIRLFSDRGNVQAAMGRYDGAIRDYSTLLESAPSDRDALYNRAIAYHLQGNTAAACADLARASELGSDPAKRALVEICGR
jgi:tetratricopeptide (TPR) repeat protein